MALINNLEDFKNITSNITSFSHAYLLKVNSLENGFLYAKELARTIIISNCLSDVESINYQIENDEYDDLYVVNPLNSSINSSEINALFEYMKTKSIYENGKRVYIICGFERVSPEISNKILKFLEEPEDNVYAILLTADIDKILPTIISRCQVISINCQDNSKYDKDEIIHMVEFVKKILILKKSMIAYFRDYFENDLSERETVFRDFSVIEYIISENIKKKSGYQSADNCIIKELQQIEIKKLISLLNITNKLKRLIKRNINLSLLLDRYIIELVREL